MLNDSGTIDILQLSLCKSPTSLDKETQSAHGILPMGCVNVMLQIGHSRHMLECGQDQSVVDGLDPEQVPS
jgi:hypothetical protein